jgi:hypothetical protein
MPKTKNAAQALLDAEASVVNRLRRQLTVQGYDGSLRVRPESVFVGRQEGRRALDVLRQFSKRTTPSQD